MASSFSANSDQFLSSLDAEIERLQQIRTQVAAALGVTSAPKKKVGRPRKQASPVDEPKVRKMSQEGRRRIAEAQKARWAKQKKQATKAAAQPVAANRVGAKKAVATKVTPKKAAAKSVPAKKVAAKKIAAKKVPAKKESESVPARKAAPAKKAPAKQVKTPVATSSAETMTDA